MFKWIFCIFLVYGIVGFLVWNFSAPRQLSAQIDVKTMSLTNPDYIFKEVSECSGDCRNRRSSSSWGGGSSGGK